MDGEGQRTERHADVPGHSTSHKRHNNLSKGGPDLGSPRGLTDHTHHEQTPKSGATIPASHGIEAAKATQGHPDPLHGAQPQTHGYLPLEPRKQGFGARHRNHRMRGGWRIRVKHHQQGHMQ